MNYKYFRCSELIDVRDGTHDSPKYQMEGYPLITSKNIKNNNIIFDDVNLISEDDYKKINERSKVDKGDILMPMIGTIGNPVIVDVDPNFAVKNVALFKFKDNQQVYNRYFYYLLKSNIVLQQLSSLKRGGTQSFVSLKNLRELKIPVPSYEQQIKIANILDQAQELIDKRKAQIEALDELIQSVFYDMFGDPIQNPKGFNKKAIGKEFEIKTGATPSRKDETYWDNGTIPWVKTTELKEVVIYDTDECITELGFNNSSVNLLPKNTLLIAMYGQGKTRGMTGKLGIEATTNQACAALLPTDKNNQDFIWIQLRCLYEELRNLGRGGNQPNLNTNLIKSFEILFPPIELQNQFAEIVASIQKQKELLNESLVELENNFNSLMHRAFKGELF